ncbi:MAG: hypothetical protein R3A46_16360 [Thermomicrobiales bacterium]
MHRFQPDDDLGHLLVDVLERFDTDRVDDQTRQAEHVLGLDDVFLDDLVRHMEDGVGRPEGAVGQLGISIEEDALPGHEDVIEDDDRIHLLEAGTERVIVLQAVEIVRLPADKLQAGRAAGDDEAEGVRGVLGIGFDDRRGKDLDLVGHRSESGEHSGALDDDAVVALLFDPGCQEGIGLLVGGFGAVGLRVDQRVSQTEVFFARLLIVVDDVVAEAGVVVREEIVGGGEGHDRRAEIVRRPAEHAVRVQCPAPHSRPALLQIRLALRLHEGCPDAVAGIR